MASHVFLHQHRRTFNDAQANNEESCQNIFCTKVIEKFLSPVAQAIIKADAPV
jgi:hypothetical protein